MTIQEFAKMLDGREMGYEMISHEEERAEELGFVVVFEASGNR